MIDLFEEGKKVLGVGKYISIDDLIAAYPNGVTVNGIQIANFKNKNSGKVTPTPVMTFREDPSLYFKTDVGDLNKLVTTWVKLIGNIDAVQDYLSKNNIGLKIWRTRTSDNRLYTKAAMIKKVVADNIIEIPEEVEIADDEVIDDETGEVIQPSQDGSLPF